MLRAILPAATWFVAGATLAAAPFFLRAHLLAAEELARGQPTMGPGITAFVGLLAAPLGGAAALLVRFWWKRRKARSAE